MSNSKVLLLFVIIQYICLHRVTSSTPHKRVERSIASWFGFGDKDTTYDPDVDLDTAQIVRRHGYPSEEHVIVTEDGYLLRLHRIPGDRSGERGGQPVFLQHGVLGSSADWVLLGKNSLAFQLADAGYDVWMGNARGNVYSKGHLNMSICSSQYWNFSFHEMGMYDLPAALYFVSNTTNNYGKILYVGHSMGTTMFYVFASSRPQDAKNVEFMISLAPVAYMTHLTSPIRYLAPFTKDAEWLVKQLGINEFLPSSKIVKFLGYECSLINKGGSICRNILFIIAGLDKQQFDNDMFPLVLAHDPAGASTKTILHYSQEIAAKGKFQQYDYGPNGNMIKYGTLTPPQYKLENIKVPNYLIYADSDILVSPIDVKRFASVLVNNKGIYEVPLPSFNHLDFIFGRDAPTLAYESVLKALKNYTMY